MSKTFFGWVEKALGVAVLVCAFAPQASQSQTLEDILGLSVRDNVQGALAVLGISAVPNESASTLFLDRNSAEADGFEFQSGQFGGGFRVSEDTPIYLEGYLGFSRYDPVYILTSGGSTTKVPSYWTSITATGGIGWQFDLDPHWKLRPMINFSIGRVQSDSSIAAQIISDELELELDFLSGGGLTALGYGASLVAEYNRRWQNDVELDLRFRHTHMRFTPLESNLSGSANATSTVAWTRVRVPTGMRAFSRPARLVGEFSASYLPGDQGKILDSEWLAQIGLGFELDVTKTKTPLISQARLMVRYAKGDNLEGYSVGLAFTF